VHCTAQEECDALKALGIGRGVVIPLGIDESLLSDRGPRLPADPPYVATVSRLHPVKGLEVLIDAFAAATASDRLRHWHLKIAGDGDRGYVDRLRRLATGSCAADRIEFPGWVDGSVKANLIEGASVFALTSHHENFGVALVEALAHGVPAVVTRGVQLSSFVEQAGAGWVTTPDMDALRPTLADALSNDDARAQRGAAARALASRWRWPVVAGQLVQLYQRVLTSSSLIAPRPAIERAEARAK
jgi:glycosyltransferase involved in cell wall biosynthesis